MTTIFKFETIDAATAQKILGLLAGTALVEGAAPVTTLSVAPVSAPSAPALAAPSAPPPPRIQTAAAPVPAAPPPPVPTAPAAPPTPPAPIVTAPPAPPPAPPVPTATAPIAPPAPPAASAPQADSLTIDQVLAEMSATIQRGVSVVQVRGVNQGLCGDPRAQSLKPEHFASAIQQYRALAAG